MRRLTIGFGTFLGWVEKALFAVAVAALGAIAVIMVTSITLRQLGSSIPDDIIIVQQFMLLSIACALPYATGQRAHIEVDLLYKRLGDSARRMLDLVAIAAGLIAILPVALWAIGDFLAFFQSGRFYYGKLQMPEWPARLFFALGLALVAMRIVQQGAADLLGIAEPADTQPEHH